jgi:hypothetical protein
MVDKSKQAELDAIAEQRANAQAGSTQVIMRNLGIASSAIAQTLRQEVPTFPVPGSRVDNQRLETGNNSFAGAMAEEASSHAIMAAMAPGLEIFIGLAAGEILEKTNEDEGEPSVSSVKSPLQIPRPTDILRS